MKKSLLKKIILTGLGLILICFLVTVYEIYSYSKVDETIKADAAVILGTAVWGDQPSPVFKERINHAIKLYQNETVDFLIFTGGTGNGEHYSEAKIGKLYAIENGVPENRIFMEGKSTITDENLAFSKEIILENNFSRVLIVSDPLHMKRAMLMAKNHGLDAYSSPTKTSRYISSKSRLGFLMRETFFYWAYKTHRIFR